MWELIIFLWILGFSYTFSYCFTVKFRYGKPKEFYNLNKIMFFLVLLFINMFFWPFWLGYLHGTNSNLY